MRRFSVLLAVAGAMLALPAPAAAHHLVVDPAGHGNGTEHWVGGGPLPDSANGQGLHPGPPGSGDVYPAAHSAGPNNDKGLVQACMSTRENPSRASFIPPGPGGPNDADCQHGPP